ncbi:MAG: N-acetylmuramoyl-L-alanine amidase [Phycisphaerales bacterium]|nr:N-acetylmuramoyl-L-alanine amidase [Phycisphaerales bacterium]
MTIRPFITLLSGLITLALIAGCAARPPQPLARRGDEIMIAGQLFHTGAPVVLWTDPGGYDAYRTERRFAPWDGSEWGKGGEKGLETPARYGVRRVPLSPEEFEQVRGGGWTLDLLRRHVDQFVIHYDAAGTSRTCFRILHDLRGLSVHFMLDLDGTIYQTLDVKERAWHATIANDRSVGIEIANIGAYPPDKAAVLSRWYTADSSGLTRITIPPELGDGGLRTPGFVARPRNAHPITAVAQGQVLTQYDLTPQQYDSLIKLTAALCTALPAIRCDYPRDPDGRPRGTALSPSEFAGYTGLLGHLHVQENKADPGPAFDWELVTREARRRMGSRPAPYQGPASLAREDGAR